MELKPGAVLAVGSLESLVTRADLRDGGIIPERGLIDLHPSVLVGLAHKILKDEETWRRMVGATPDAKDAEPFNIIIAVTVSGPLRLSGGENGAGVR